MSESFGARLRQERERRQIALASIAAETKISPSLLEALERDDLSHWPTGIFRRGFIRDYARVVGLDGDATVREFLERYPDPIDLTPASLRSEDADTAPPPTGFRHLVSSAVDAFRRLHKGNERDPDITAPAEKAIVVSTTPDLEPAAPSVPEGTPTTSNGPAAAGPQEAPAQDVDLLAVAGLCTDLGRIVETNELEQMLARAAAILGAAGIIIWVFDTRAGGLIPAFVHGYAEDARTRLPIVRPEADNATAASFRLAQTRIVAGRGQANGAVVVPMLGSIGCRGVLAVELADGREHSAPVLALAMIFAAQLATLVGTASAVDVVNL